MTKHKNNLANRLSRLYFLRFTQKGSMDKYSKIILIYSISLFILCFWFILIPILFNIYLGILIYRHRILKKIGNTIRNQCHRTFKKKYHYFIAVILFFIYLFIFIMILFMIFTIPIIVLLIVGFLIEKRRAEPKKTKNESFVIRIVESDLIDKKESIVREQI